MRKIILAEKLGFCFGVDRAYKTALEKSDDNNLRTYTLGSLIHNERAVNYLKDKGVDPIDTNIIDTLDSHNEIIIRSHGVTEKTTHDLKNNFESIIDCTCPYVKKIQIKAKEYFQKGYQIVIVGDANHPEIIGINGWCDNSAFITRTSEAIPEFNKPICVLAQTTEKKDTWDKVVEAIKKANPQSEIAEFNTICSATTHRQLAAKTLSQEVGAMIVIGGKHSSNTKKLYEICKIHCENTQLVSNSEEIDLTQLNSIDTIGITAGASTPDWIIQEVVEYLRDNIEERI